MLEEKLKSLIDSVHPTTLRAMPFSLKDDSSISSASLDAFEGCSAHFHQSKLHFGRSPHTVYHARVASYFFYASDYKM